jgi:hypothetical protein
MKARSLILVSLLYAAGCSQGIVLAPPPEADISFDGLVRVESSKIQNVWINPDVDLARYSRFLLDDIDLEFRVPRRDESSASRLREFPLSDDDKRSLTEVAGRAFGDELSQSEYLVRTDDPGPDVLRIHVRLTDIVALAPSEPDPNRNIDAASMSEGFVSSVGEATLVGEFFDSTTGGIVARVVERRAAKQAVGGIHASRTNNWAEVVPGFERWAGIIRDDMDAIHDL